jgi:hypothetical protein
MGYQVYVNAVYGVQLNKNDLEVVDAERGCSHELPDTPAKFCPECGKPVFVEVRKKILVPSTLDDFKRDYDDDSFILGVSLGSLDTYNDKPNTVRKITEEEKLELKDFLEAYGFKQAPQIWLVLQHSY